MAQPARMRPDRLRRVSAGRTSLAGWMAELAPASTFAIRTDGHRRGDMARMARRLAGRAVGIVLSGGGARAFAHLGVLERLQSAGVVLDRVGGVSMGAFIGGLLACGHDSHAIDAYCYEEWVRRNPINDYTLPRTALIKGDKARAMLDTGLRRRPHRGARPRLLLRERRSQEQHLVIDRDGPVHFGGRMQHGDAADRPAAAARRTCADRRLAARQPSARADDVHRRGPGARHRHQGRRGAHPAGRRRRWQTARNTQETGGACACRRCRERYPASRCFRARTPPKPPGCTPTSRSRCGYRAWACSSFTRSTRRGQQAVEQPPRRSRNHHPGCCPSTCRSPTHPAGVRS